MKASKSIVILLALLFVPAEPARAQAICAASDEFSSQQMSDLRATATSKDSATVAIRQAQGIPAADSLDIEFVTDATVCAQAGTAYAQAERDSLLTGGRVAQPGDSTLGTVVHVFRVANRYIVIDERNMAGEFTIGWVFDQTFATPLKRIGI